MWQTNLTQEPGKKICDDKDLVAKRITNHPDHQKTSVGEEIKTKILAIKTTEEHLEKSYVINIR